MEPHEKMHVCAHHPDLEDLSAFLPSDTAEERAQEPGQASVYQRLAAPGCPNDVAIEAVDHEDESAPEGRPTGIILAPHRAQWARAGRFSGRAEPQLQPRHIRLSSEEDRE